MHHHACHHWSKMYAAFGVLAKNPPKSSVKRQFLLVRKNFKI